MNRRIGIVSVGRSDRGHLAPLLALLPEAIVYKPDPRYSPRSDEPVDISVAASLAMEWFTLCWHNEPRPDLLVVFGDRWEQLAAAVAAHLLGIPIVHLHAGETTQAVYDDGNRAAISALATHHVAAAEPYAERLRAQGYRSVHCLGAPGLGRLKPARPRGSHSPLMLVQFHPETKNVADIPRQVDELREALLTFRDAAIIMTEPGMDAGRQHILDGLGVWEFQEFTDEQWIDMLHTAAVLVGNSSCGIIETPSIPLPSVNIGDRQKGRVMASSVICVPHDRLCIQAAIATALEPEWRAKNLTGVNPYGDRGAAQRIADFLREVEV